MLFDNAKLQPGETILVHAGGSGIGSAAIKMAKAIGCTVITTVGDDGKVEKAKALNPDLIVLDVSMPVMNGLEAARILHEIMPSVPVILCSLHTDRILEMEARSAGVDAVFSKAENMQTLINKARELLNV